LGQLLLSNSKNTKKNELPYDPAVYQNLARNFHLGSARITDSDSESTKITYCLAKMLKLQHHPHVKQLLAEYSYRDLRINLQLLHGGVESQSGSL